MAHAAAAQSGGSDGLVGLLLIDRPGHVLWTDDAAEALLGQPGGLLGRPILEVLGVRPPGQESAYDTELPARIAAEGPAAVTFRALPEPVGATIVELRIRRPDPMALPSSLPGDMFRTAFHANPNGMAIFGLDGRVVAVNAACAAMLGRSEEWLLEHTAPDVVAPEDLEQAGAAFARLVAGEPNANGETRMLRPDGTSVWTRWTIALIRGTDDTDDHILAQYQDLTPARTAVAKLDYLATYDPVTGIHNRSWITQRLAEAIAGARPDAPAGVLLVDLDRFRLVNDSLGYEAGNELLGTIAERFSLLLPVGCAIGRLSGVEFLIVVPRAGSQARMRELAARAQQIVSQETAISGRRIVPSASVGVAMAQHEDTPEGVRRAAALALAKAKSQGPAAVWVFDDDLARAAATRLATEVQLREALDAKQFLLHFQPVVRLSDREVVAYETLVRWDHPELGLIGPEMFIEVAEDSGLIRPIGRQVLALACAHAASGWAGRARIAVNLSASELADPELPAAWQDAMRRAAVPASRFIVEVTETAILMRRDLAAELLTEMHRRGAGVHLDDFGTGFSAIDLIRDLPVTGIKLDRSFVANVIDPASRERALSAGLAGLAHGLALDSVAEGVETEEQAQVLGELGWEFGQGYWLGKPGPAPGAPVVLG